MRERNPQARLQYTWVPYERISANLKRAMIAAEDAKFVEHEGFDWDGIQLAIDKNAAQGARRRRRIDDHAAARQEPVPVRVERSYWRKGEEALITVMLEAMLDKRRIFEIYLNVIEWGNGVFGMRSRGATLFRRRAAQLGASRRRASRRWRPIHGSTRAIPARAASRRKIPIILARMPTAELP